MGLPLNMKTSYWVNRIVTWLSYIIFVIIILKRCTKRFKYRENVRLNFITAAGV